MKMQFYFEKYTQSQYTQNLNTLKIFNILQFYFEKYSQSQYTQNLNILKI